MRKFDFLLLLIVVILTFFGLLMIYDASSYIAFRDFHDKYHYIKDQSLWAALGFLTLITFSFFDYHKLYNLALPMLLLALVLLSLVFIPGVGVHVLGAKRWISTGLFVLQPAEYVKLSLAVYLSAWFSSKERGRFLPFLLLLGLVMILVMLEPDMGTAVIILSEALLIYFLSGGSLLHFAYLVPMLFLASIALIKLEPYRASRLTSFLQVNKSLEDTSYHVKQILIALGMGGIAGVGLGNSLQKYAYLPENTTDSIFAIIAEELGLIGATVLIVILFLMIWRGFLIADKAKDRFGKLLAGGITGFLAVQILVNLGAQTALLPLTGVPLPFLSYGGSSLLINMCSVGILLNISKQRS